MKNEATDFVENKPDSKKPGKNEPKKSEEEARSLGQILEAAVGARQDVLVLSLGLDAAAQTYILAMQVLGVCAKDLPVFELVCQRHERLKGAFYALLTQRHDTQPRFSSSSPSPLQELVAPLLLVGDLPWGRNSRSPRCRRGAGRQLGLPPPAAKSRDD